MATQHGNSLVRVHPAQSHAWAYQSAGPRDERLDLLRGFCIFVMIVDHIGGRSFLHWLTGGNAFYVSAAEGFVFISGLLVGIVYRGILARDGMAAATRKALRRALTLYALMAVLTAGLLAVGQVAGKPWADPGARSPAGLLFAVLTFQQTFFLTDVLMLYALLLAGTPLVLWMLRRGWTRALLAGSWMLWLAYQLVPALPPAELSGWHPAAWQILFVHAVALGYHRQRARQAWTPQRQRVALVSAAAVLCLLLALFVARSVAVPPLLDGAAAGWLDAAMLKDGLRPGRLIAALALFTLLYWLVTYAWLPLRGALGWLLLPLGQASLRSYTLHIPLVVAFELCAPDVAGMTASGMLANTMLQLCAVMLVLWLVRRRVLK